MVGAFSAPVIVPPTNPVFAISSGFSSVTNDPTSVTTATFTIARGGDSTVACTVTYQLVAAAVNPLTSAYLTDPTVLTGKVVSFGVGVTSVPVVISFTAHAAPTVDLQASVVLTASSVGTTIQPGQDQFAFVLNKGNVAVNGLYDLGAGGGGYAARWTPQLGNGSGIVITQEANGIVVDCASAGNVQTATNVAAMLWAQTALPTGAWRAQFTLTQLDGNVSTQSNGIYVQLMPGYSGGRNGSDANPNLWTTAQYRDPLLPMQANSAVLDKYGTGIRASFDQDALVLSNSHQLRAHDITNTGAEGNIGGANYAASFSFVQNTPYTIEVEWKPIAGTFTWTKTDSSGNVETVPISDPLVATWMGQYLGLNVSAVRQVRIEGFTVTPFIETVVSSREDDPAQWPVIGALSTIPGGNRVALTTLAQLANTVAGKTYLLGGDVSGTTVTIDGVGTITNPIQIRGDQEGATKRKLTATKIIIQDAAYVSFRDVDIADTQIEFRGTSHHISFEKGISYGRTGGIEQGQFMFETGAGCDDPIRYIRVRYWQYGKPGVTTSVPLLRIHGARHTNFLFPNHPRFMYFYKILFLNVNDDANFQCVFTMTGDNDRDWYRDIQLSIYDCLMYNCTSPIIAELKHQGCWVSRVTYDRGTVGAAAYWRNRHSANQYLGNLFVTRAGGPSLGGRGGFSIRDKGCQVINNHSYTLADGAQPTLSSPGGDNSDVVGLFTGNLDATLYPTNEGDGQVHSLWPFAMGTECGGNNMPVVVGDAGGGNLPAINCIVPPSGGARKDRNASVNVLHDSDFAGRGKYRLATTGSPVYVGPPAYGTLVGNHTTDTSTSLVPKGADITQVPHRWLQSEVGPGAGPP